MRPSAGALAFTAATVILVLLVLGAALGIVVLAATPADLAALRDLPRNTWWFTYRDSLDSPSAALWRIGAAVIASLISLAGVLRAWSRWRRSPSPVIPFVMLFLFTLGLECLRAPSALLAASDSFLPLSVLLTRVVYWGRFLGLLSLVLAGVYCLEMKYRRLEVLGAALMLLAFAMAAYIPVDRTVFLSQLTWKLGDEQTVWFLNAALEALAVLTCVAAAITRRQPGLPRFAVAVALFVVTREVEFFAVQPVPVVLGLAAQAAATVLCLSRWGDGGRSDPRPPAG